MMDTAEEGWAGTAIGPSRLGLGLGPGMPAPVFGAVGRALARNLGLVGASGLSTGKGISSGGGPAGGSTAARGGAAPFPAVAAWTSPTDAPPVPTGPLRTPYPVKCVTV